MCAFPEDKIPVSIQYCKPPPLHNWLWSPELLWVLGGAAKCWQFVSEKVLVNWLFLLFHHHTFCNAYDIKIVRIHSSLATCWYKSGVHRFCSAQDVGKYLTKSPSYTCRDFSSGLLCWSEDPPEGVTVLEPLGEARTWGGHSCGETWVDQWCFGCGHYS